MGRFSAADVTGAAASSIAINLALLLGAERAMLAGVNAATLLFMRNDPRRAIDVNFI